MRSLYERSWYEDTSLSWQRWRSWNTNWLLIQGVALLPWLHILCVQCKVSAAWQCIHLLLTNMSRHHRGTFSKAVCSDQTCHSPVVSWKMIWTDGFSLWLPQTVKTFLEGRMFKWPVKWHSSSLLNWKVVFEGSWWKLPLTLYSGRLVVWLVREGRRMGPFPPCHDCTFALFSEFPWAKVSQFDMGKAEGHQQKLMQVLMMWAGQRRQVCSPLNVS